MACEYFEKAEFIYDLPGASAGHRATAFHAPAFDSDEEALAWLRDFYAYLRAEGARNIIVRGDYDLAAIQG